MYIYPAKPIISSHGELIAISPTIASDEIP